MNRQFLKKPPVFFLCSSGISALLLHFDLVQGILLAGRIHTLVLSMMDLHSLLEASIM